MPFQLIRDNITNMKVDVIVNSANPGPTIGGGVDFAIHEAGGKDLVEARINLGYINTGEAKYTKGYNLPSKYVIHTVGPVWHNGKDNEEQKLYYCYINSLNLALELKAKSIAFPLLYAGVFGYPKDQAIKVATQAIKQFLNKHDLNVYLVIFDDKSFKVSNNMFDNIESFIDNNIVALQSRREKAMGLRQVQKMEAYSRISFDKENEDFSVKDNTWQEELFKWIDKKELTNPEVYKKANLTKQHFSKILKDKDYHPSKPTAIALCIALKLDLDETMDLIEKAGYHLSLSIKFDLIIRYFINQKDYDIFEINNVLFDNDQELLGAVIY